MDKQIEELAKDLQEAWMAWSLSADLPKPYAFVAEILAKKWQPKMHQGVVDYIETYKQGFKEGVEAVRVQLKNMAYQSTDWSHGVHPMVVEVDEIDEICNELVDEK